MKACSAGACRCRVADGMVFCAAAEDVDDVQAWLAAAGAAMPVHPQVQDADLGRRMIAALTAAATAPAQASAMTGQESAAGNPLDRGLQNAQHGQDPAAICSTKSANPMGQCYDAAIVIGTDIPDISSEVLAAAVQVLLPPSSSAQAADVVLGPAADGGYYLLGLRTPALLRADIQDCSIFEGVQWSCSSVLQRTVAASTRLGLSVAPTYTLPTLQDIDTRQDAAVWVDQQQAEAGRMAAQQEASAVTPQAQMRVQMQQLLTDCVKQQ